MRRFGIFVLLFTAAISLRAADSCFTIHGRAHYYAGDGQLRIWHIGTHHEFEPDESTWERVKGWLESGVTEADRKRYAIPVSMIDLFADFSVCPVEEYKAGSVQKARIVSAAHRRYAPMRGLAKAEALR
jgi:hypothetical protein